jgi:hypothetical protein
VIISFITFCVVKNILLHALVKILLNITKIPAFEKYFKAQPAEDQLHAEPCDIV